MSKKNKINGVYLFLISLVSVLKGMNTSEFSLIRIELKRLSGIMTLLVNKLI